MGFACYDRAIPNGEMPGGIQKIPSELVLVGKDKETVITQIHVANDTYAAIWVYVCDGDGDAIIPHEVILPFTSRTWPFDHGIRADQGVKWQAEKDGLTGEVFGYQ